MTEDPLFARSRSRFGSASDDDSSDDSGTYFRDAAWDPRAYGSSESESDDSAYFDEYDDYDSDGYLYDDYAYEPPAHLVQSASSNRQTGRRHGTQAPAASTPQPKPKPPPPVLCRFFVLGKCKYGSHCSYSHTLPPSAANCEMTEEDHLNAAAALVDCPYFVRGNCKYGQYCRLRHYVPTDTRGVAQPRESTAASAAPSSTNQRAVDAGERDHTCGICFDDVVEAGKYFGLLSTSLLSNGCSFTPL